MRARASTATTPVRLDDQRIDFGLDDTGIVDEREQRQPVEGLGQRFDVAGRTVAVAAKYAQRRRFLDHGPGGLQAERGAANDPVRGEFGESPAEAEDDETAPISRLRR